ncbi:MAG: IclR family transcriptional regulator [Actinobacteria bacterium]|nr:IclR family transcriptional regulator [Actinomycetota bacterium]
MGEETALRGAQSVDRAIRILKVFSTDRPTLTLAEVAAAVSLTPPTTHRLLQALRAQDLVVFDEHRRHYTLGSGVMRIAGVVLDQELLASARVRLAELRDATGETVALHWRLQDSRVCLIELVSERPVHMASGVGNSYPLTAGAAGKAMLAFTDPIEVERLLEQSLLGVADRDELRAALPSIRALGYAGSMGETVPGGVALAAPLLDAEGRAVAALNVTGPGTRMGSTDIPALGASLSATAAWLTHEFVRDGVGTVR